MSNQCSKFNEGVPGSYSGHRTNLLSLKAISPKEARAVLPQSGMAMSFSKIDSFNMPNFMVSANILGIISLLNLFRK